MIGGFLAGLLGLSTGGGIIGSIIVAFKVKQFSAFPLAGRHSPSRWPGTGNAASKAEAQFLASYSAPAGQWQSDGYGISRVADAQPIAKTTGPKCWYVRDVQFCD